MPPTYYIYKVVVDKIISIGLKNNGMRERLTYYFNDIGDLSFPKRLEEWFGKGRLGKLDRDYFVVEIVCLGESLSTKEE